MCPFIRPAVMRHAGNAQIACAGILGASFFARRVDPIPYLFDQPLWFFASHNTLSPY